MEDILYYIGLGLIITFSLVRKSGKAAARKASKQSSKPKSDSAPGFPALESVIYEYTRTKETENAKQQSMTMKVDKFSEAQSLETIIDEEEEYMRRTANAPKPKSKKTKAKATNNISAKTSSPANTVKSVKNSENNAILEEFDLREAVIYSEIMKPKFEE